MTECIVEKLRSYPMSGDGVTLVAIETLHRAADEIERLRLRPIYAHFERTTIRAEERDGGIYLMALRDGISGEPMRWCDLPCELTHLSLTDETRGAVQAVDGRASQFTIGEGATISIQPSE